MAICDIQTVIFNKQIFNTLFFPTSKINYLSFLNLMLKARKLNAKNIPSEAKTHMIIYKDVDSRSGSNTISYESFGTIPKEIRKKMFYLMMHSAHFIYGYMASDIW